MRLAKLPSSDTLRWRAVSCQPSTLPWLLQLVGTEQLFQVMLPLLLVALLSPSLLLLMLLQQQAVGAGRGGPQLTRLLLHYTGAAAAAATAPRGVQKLALG
jgi:hypothetical protein